MTAFTSTEKLRDREYLIGLYSQYSRKQIADIFKVTKETIRYWLRKHGIVNVKPRDVVNKINSYQCKGKTPWNKGTVGICKSNSGTFKEGHKMPLDVRRKISATEQGIDSREYEFVNEMQEVINNG